MEGLSRNSVKLGEGRLCPPRIFGGEDFVSCALQIPLILSLTLDSQVSQGPHVTRTFKLLQLTYHAL